jgi:hypothetical protein
MTKTQAARMTTRQLENMVETGLDGRMRPVSDDDMEVIKDELHAR